MNCPHCGNEINQKSTSRTRYDVVHILCYIFLFPVLAICSATFLLSGFLGVILGFVKLFGELLNWSSTLIEHIGIMGVELPLLLEFFMMEVVCIIVIIVGLVLFKGMQYFYTKIKIFKNKNKALYHNCNIA